MMINAPGMSSSRENLSRFISRVATHSPHLVRKIAGRGGGLEVHLDALPDEARAAITRRQTAAIVSLQVEAEDLADAIETDRRQINRIAYDGLTGRQRRIMEARSAVLLAIETMAMLRDCSRDRAIRAFLDDLDQGHAEAEIVAMVRLANDRTDGVQLSARTVYRWFSARSEFGVAALAPRATREKQDLPQWFPAFFEHYKKPSKPGVEEALRDYIRTLPPGAPRPTQQAVRRALKKLPLLQRLKGRSGQLALRARRAYTVRDFSDLLPTSVYVADGKTFDAEIAHPLHGQPFRPELTTIIDVATRRVVGWSAALDENSSAVADALRRACQMCGIPAIFYTDRGPGYRNKTLDAPTTGLLGRAGITAMRALPYNSQAKGVVERLNQVYTAAAKGLPTYMGRDMDKEAKLLVFKTTRRELAVTGTSRLLTGWDAFIDHINQTLSAYNDRPHSSLPRIRDEQTGRMRHQTPNECWAQKTQGFELIMPSDDEARAMFRPHVVRRTRRALVDWLGNSYFAIELEPFDAQEVIVGYDIHDASTVHVHRIEEDEDGDRVPGALIAIARFRWPQDALCAAFLRAGSHGAPCQGSAQPVATQDRCGRAGTAPRHASGAVGQPGCGSACSPRFATACGGSPVIGTRLS